MKKRIKLIIFLFCLKFLIIISCAGGFGTDSSNADDIGNEIFGSDST